MSELTGKTLSLIEQHLEIACSMLRNVRSQLDASDSSPSHQRMPEMSKDQDSLLEKKFIDVIRAAGPRGLTRFDLNKRKFFQRLSKPKQDDLLKSALDEGEIFHVYIKTKGHPREPFVVKEFKTTSPNGVSMPLKQTPVGKSPRMPLNQLK